MEEALDSKPTNNGYHQVLGKALDWHMPGVSEPLRLSIRLRTGPQCVKMLGIDP